jgi:UPF0716 family protein affecting phage T7 exclusion
MMAAYVFLAAWIGAWLLLIAMAAIPGLLLARHDAATKRSQPTD